VVRSVEVGSLRLWRFDLFSNLDGLLHCVTSRHGGVSEAPYQSLNLGLHVGDDPARVIENRRRVCEALGVEFEQLTLGQQVHGDRVRVVEASEAGQGRERFADGIPDSDGLIVREPGIAIGVFVADCVPMLLYDPDHRIAAAVHAGWRGTASGIAGKAVRALQACGARPEALIAGIGPAIGRCCYEVNEEVAAAVGVAERRAGMWYADLAEANRRQLVVAGLREDRVEMSGVCTACRADEFYSERRLGRPTGRFAAFVVLR
jgi:YfiH family protein